MNVAFCDDNYEFASLLSKHVLQLWRHKNPVQGNNICVYCFNNGNKVIEFAKKIPIDVVFLDINMSDVNGFEVAKRLIQLNNKVLIVFVSGYDFLVYDSFDFCPIGFLRKGMVYEELPRMIDKLSKRLEKAVQLTIKTSYGDIQVYTKDIVLVNSVGNYCFVMMSNKIQHSTRCTLSSFEKSVVDYDFFRVHSAYIINLNHIQGIDKNSSVLMGLEKIIVPISQRRWPNFKKAYSEFIKRRFI